MHQLTPTYKQAVHFEMAAILQPLLPPSFHPLFWHANTPNLRQGDLMERLESTAAHESTGLGWMDVRSAPLPPTARTNVSDSRLVNNRRLFSQLIKTSDVLASSIEPKQEIELKFMGLFCYWYGITCLCSRWLILAIDWLCFCFLDWLNKWCASDWALWSDERQDFIEVVVLLITEIDDQ